MFCWYEIQYVSFATEIEMKTPKELISEIVAAGFKQTQIAKETGIHKATISRLSLGTSQSISFMRMNALIECHRRLMIKARRSAARRSRSGQSEAA